MYCLLLISDCVWVWFITSFFLSGVSSISILVYFSAFFFTEEMNSAETHWIIECVSSLIFLFSFSIELILLPLLPFAKSLFHAYLTLVSTHQPPVSTHQPPVYPKSFHATLSISACNLNLTLQLIIIIIIIIIKYIYFLLIEMGNLFFYFWSFLKSVDFMCIFKG